MPRIEFEPKLDFKDVLLRPKRSTLKSRADVDLVREYTIMAGNVVTCEMVEELLLSGADIIKVGIGPGSVCTTRKKAGVGYPQLSAVLECADAAHGLGGHVMSDGGCTNPGDVAKAFGAGADFVMVGGLLAGHDQSGGEIIEQNGRRYKLFYGMSSDTAMNKHHGSVAEYRASEGKTITIPYRGDVNETIFDILGGIRSACTYTGSAKLKELPKRTTFIRVTQQTNDMQVPKKPRNLFDEKALIWMRKASKHNLAQEEEQGDCQQRTHWSISDRPGDILKTAYLIMTAWYA
ncbi:putative GMP reductase [Teladorsagia circumcincta]|uniref:GMP reductase n=1 Tax=Teladorsagia circumcincta TaxID=45464 RepID=A0A2G9UGL8_TELCI|nr:putative GMP reductase [Teladorsagia circumcincta]